jgi:3-phenylpropionate/trans-cinnamate dioxygenase ferredoxin subunit
LKHVVGTLDELPPGSRKIVTVAGRSIGIFNVDGRLYAVRNRCPHQGAALCKGDLFGNLESGRPGEYRYSTDRPLLRCPWHGWEFDLGTGQSWFDPERTRVKSYEVSLGELDGPREGPYVVETYPVESGTGRSIVVEL